MDLAVKISYIIPLLMGLGLWGKLTWPFRTIWGILLASLMAELLAHSIVPNYFIFNILQFIIINGFTIVMLQRLAPKWHLGVKSLLVVYNAVLFFNILKDGINVFSTGSLAIGCILLTLNAILVLQYLLYHDAVHMKPWSMFAISCIFFYCGTLPFFLMFYYTLHYHPNYAYLLQHNITTWLTLLSNSGYTAMFYFFNNEKKSIRAIA